MMMARIMAMAMTLLVAILFLHLLFAGVYFERTNNNRGNLFVILLGVHKMSFISGSRAK